MPRPVKLLGVALGVLGSAALLLGAIVATFEFAIPLDGQRDRITRALSEALGMPVVLSGPVKAYTGPRAGFEVSQVRVGASGGGDPLQVDIERLAVRLHLIPLLHGDIRIADAVAEGSQVCVSRGSTAAGRTAAAPRQGPELIAIEHLRVLRLSFATDAACATNNDMPELTLLELAAPPDAPLRLRAQAKFKGEDATLELQGPSLAAIAGRSGAEPFELSARFAGATASVHGMVNVADRSVDGDVAFGTDQMAKLIGLLGAPVKEFGPLRVNAHISADRSHTNVQVREMALGPHQVTGRATLTWAGPRPSFLLEANTAALDAIALRDKLFSSIDSSPHQSDGLTRLALGALRASEGRVTLGIGQLGAGPIALSDVLLDSTWDQGESKATFKALLGRSHVTGTLSADLRTDEAVFLGTANARQLSLPAGLGVMGTLRSVDATLDGRGLLGVGRLTRLRADVRVDGAELDVPTDNGKTARLSLERVLAQWRERETLIIDAKGAIASQSVRVRVAGADAPALWQRRPWKLQASGEAGPMRLDANGTLTWRSGGVSADLELNARADRLAALAGNNAALAKLPFAADGSVHLKESTWSADLRRVQLGQSRARLTAAGDLPMTTRPLRADVSCDVLDLAEMVGPSAAAGGDGLPQHLALPAADLSVHAAKVLLPGLAVDKATVNGTIRDGKLTPSAFSFELDGARVAGTIAADLTGSVARLAATANATGLTERHFGNRSAEAGVRFELGEVTLSASSSGNGAADLVANAAAVIDVRQTTFSVEGVDTGSTPSGTVATAGVSINPRQPTQLKLDGELVGLRFHVDGSSAALPDLLPPADAPFRISGRVADIDVSAEGHLPGPGSAERPLIIGVRAQTLEDFAALSGFDLPSVGPFQLDLALRDVATDHSSGQLDVGLGESRIKASLARHLVGDRTHWEVALSAPRLRLEDLGAAEWIGDDPKLSSKEALEKSLSAMELESWQRREKAIRDAIRRAVRRFDAHVSVAIDKLSSGADISARIDGDLSLESGRLRVAPLSIVGSGARFTLSADADYSLDDTPFMVDLSLSRFDYGPLLRSIHPGRAIEGQLGLVMRLSGRGKIGHIVPNLNGRLGLIVFPGSSYGLRLLQAWGGGLLRNVEQTLDPAKDSRINCGVATFQVDKGVLKSEALMLDSPRIRAAGELTIDLNSGKLNGLIAPKSKSAELFSSRAPVTIGGTLTAPTVAPAAGSVLLTGARYFYFAYAYLFDTASGGQLAADGRPDCIAAYEKVIQ